MGVDSGVVRGGGTGPESGEKEVLPRVISSQINTVTEQHRLGFS